MLVSVPARLRSLREAPFRHDRAAGFDEEFGGGLGVGDHSFSRHLLWDIKCATCGLSTITSAAALSSRSSSLFWFPILSIPLGPSVPLDSKNWHAGR